MVLLVGVGVTGSRALTNPAGPQARNLVVNGGFEDGLDGWRSNEPADQPLALSAAAHTGRQAVALRSGRAGMTVLLNDLRNTVPSTRSGAVYQVSAWIRADRPLSGQLRVREVGSGKLLRTAGPSVPVTTTWQQVRYDYRPLTEGTSLDLNVLAWKVPAGTSVYVDDVSLVQSSVSAPPVTIAPTTAAPTPSASPTATPTHSATTTTNPAEPTPKPTKSTVTVPPAPQSPTPGQPGGCSVDQIGIPSCGAYLGAAYGSNSDPAPRERQFGDKLAVRRTYYSAAQVDKAVSIAQGDLAAGRLPWISFKLPQSWTAMADGKGDAWARDLVTKLEALDGPVWVAFHHEPEGDGDVTEWTRMQQHLAPIVHTSDNVAFTMILTGWNQFYSGNPAYSLDRLWPGDGLVDVLGIDPYNEYGVVKNGKRIEKSADLKSLYYTRVSAFAKAHGTHWGVAETGYTDEAAAKDPDWLNRSYQDLVDTGGIAFTYFDTPVNAYGSWPLDTAPKIAAFTEALEDTTRID